MYYRIAGGDAYSQYGRVEVFLGTEWGTICNQYWDDIQAHVTCKQFGYSTGDPFTGPYSVPPPKLIYGTKFQCTGDESNLNLCPHGGWTSATAEKCKLHKNDAGVFCYKSGNHIKMNFVHFNGFYFLLYNGPARRGVFFSSQVKN